MAEVNLQSNCLPTQSVRESSTAMYDCLTITCLLSLPGEKQTLFQRVTLTTVMLVYHLETPLIETVRITILPRVFYWP